MTAARQRRKIAHYVPFERGARLAMTVCDRSRFWPPRPNTWWSTAIPGWRSAASTRSPISSMARPCPGGESFEYRLRGRGLALPQRGQPRRLCGRSGPLYAAVRRLRPGRRCPRRGVAGDPRHWLIDRQAALSLLFAGGAGSFRGRHQARWRLRPRRIGRRSSARCRPEPPAPAGRLLARSPQAMKPVNQKAFAACP